MRRRTNQTSFTADGERVTSVVALLDAAGERRGDLVFDYSVADPLLVEVAVRAPGGAIALSRRILRSDLLRVTAVPDFGASVPLHARDVVIVPDPGAWLRVVLREGHARVEELVPAEDVRRFLRATERLVPYEQETAVVDRLFHLELTPAPRPDRSGQ